MLANATAGCRHTTQATALQGLSEPALTISVQDANAALVVNLGGAQQQQIRMHRQEQQTEIRAVAAHQDQGRSLQTNGVSRLIQPHFA